MSVLSFVQSGTDKSEPSSSVFSFDFIHSFIYLHSIDPYMVGKTPVDIELVKDNKTGHINYINTKLYINQS
jgi:hypothetical protein